MSEPVSQSSAVEGVIKRISNRLSANMPSPSARLDMKKSKRTLPQVIKHAQKAVSEAKAYEEKLIAMLGLDGGRGETIVRLRWPDLEMLLKHLA